jgi:5-methylcytosine-specific restriction endonuclease McrA
MTRSRGRPKGNKKSARIVPVGMKDEPTAPYKKQGIPAAVRQQVWLARIGRKFEAKCQVTWCRNVISVFQFECGHNVPESKGGSTTLDNLLPICSNCNGSMGDRYTIDEWCKKFNPKKRSFLSCFKVTAQEPASSGPARATPSSTVSKRNPSLGNTA